MQFSQESYRWFVYQYLNSQMKPYYFPPAKQLLQMQLSQALKRDFQRFCLYQSQRHVLEVKHKVQTEQDQEKKKKTQIIELSSEEEQNNQQTLKITKEKKNQVTMDKTAKELKQQKTDSSQDLSPSKKNQLNSGKQHSSGLIKKTVLIRKEKKEKIKSKVKNGYYRRLQTKIDFGQTAMIRNAPLSLQELNRKKEALLLRHVINWQQANHSRKERREIRMLMN